MMQSSDFIPFPHLLIYGLHIAFNILSLLLSDAPNPRNNTVSVMLAVQFITLSNNSLYNSCNQLHDLCGVFSLRSRETHISRCPAQSP